ncbi:MAG TPA: DUF2298 domain-containing protein [Chloroflexia bacterium]|nr:DUF2298 domain-containing protein [Chloroflexia bacterium]
MPSLLRKSWTLWALLLILGVALYTRLIDINFDQNTHQHPDERAVTQAVIDHVNLPEGVTFAQLLDPDHSPLNPRILGARYPYGALPLYIVKAVAATGAKLFNKPEWLAYDGITLVGRATSGIFDVLTVLLIFLIGRRLYGRRAGLLAAAFSALAVTQIQIAHFFISDPYMVTFLTATLYFSVILMQTRRAWAAAMAGLFLGFALACKVSVVFIGVAILAAVLLRVVYRARTRQLGPPADLDDPYGLEPAKASERTAPFGVAMRRAVALLALAAAMTFAGFFIGDPYGVRDSGFQVSLGAPDQGNPFYQLGPLQVTTTPGKYSYFLGEETATQRGTGDPPYTRQYIGTVPVLYHFQNLIQWGMGPASGLAGLAGLFAAIYLAVRRRRPAEILLLAGAAPYFLTIAALEAKWMRYMLPLVPYMCLFGAAFLLRGWNWSQAAAPRLAAWGQARARQTVQTGPPLALRARRWAFPVLTPLALLGSAAWATAFMNIYAHDHSRVIASHWINAHLPPVAAIGHEAWDDALPLGLPGDPGGSWTGVDMKIYDDRPSPEAFTYITELLSQADYIIPASNRLYDSIPRLPWRYPVQIRYYQLLMSGKLGFEQVLPVDKQKVYPELFGIKFNDDHADESFTVYDHPRVLVFKKTRSLTEDELRTLFGTTIDQPSIPIRHLEIHTPKDYDKSLMLAEPPGQQLALGDFAWNPLAENQWVAILLWLLVVEVLGLLAWPLIAVICRRLPDRGYPLSKTLALVVVGWIVWMAASSRLAPFTVWSILGSIAILAILSALTWRRFSPELREYMRAHRGLLLGWEALFGVAFLAFLVIRILNPDLWQPWNGGEKPMEFGFLNATLRSPWMPPGDPFFSGGTINYYYYGYFLVGMLIKLIGVHPAIGFNLALPLLYGLTVLGAASIVYNTVATVQRARGWRGSSSTAFGWGVIGAVLLVGIGNLTFLLQFLSMRFPDAQRAIVALLMRFGPVPEGLSRTYNGFDYWGARSVIPNTINEFPYWTFLFADLHPHLIDMSISLLVIGLIFNLLLGAWRWPLFTSLPDAFVTAPVAPVPGPGRFTRSEPSWWSTMLEAAHRLWGSSPLDGALRFGSLSLALGTLFAVNSWDFPVYLVVLLGALVLAVLGAWRAHTAGNPATRLALVPASGLGLAGTAALGIAFYAPFILNFKPFYNEIRTVTPGLQMPVTGFPEFLAIWGLFLFIGLSYLGYRLWAFPWREALADWGRLVNRTGSPTPAPAPALAAPVSAAATPATDWTLSRFETVAVPAGSGAIGARAEGSGNGHEATVRVPVGVTAQSTDDDDAYEPASVGGLGLHADDLAARERRAWMDAVMDFDATPGNGHGAENGEYNVAPEAAAPNGHEAHRQSPVPEAAAPWPFDAADYSTSEPAVRNLNAEPYTEPDTDIALPTQPAADQYASPVVEAASLNGDGADPIAVSAQDTPAVTPEVAEQMTLMFLPEDDVAADAAIARAVSEHEGMNGSDVAGGEPASGDAAGPEQLGFTFLDEDEAAARGADDVPAVPPAAPVLVPVATPRGGHGLLPAGVGLPLLALTLLGTIAFALAGQWIQATMILLLGGLITTHLTAVRSPGLLYGALLLFTGFAIALGVEYVYLADHLQGGSYYRMNTVFKFYEQVWVLVACGAAVALYALLGPRGRARHDGGWLSTQRLVWLVPFGLLFLGSLIFTVAGTQARVDDRMPGDRPPVGTLNGMAWMDKTVLNIGMENNAISGPVVYNLERPALDWLNANVKGTPVMAAAPREYYRESGMMSSTYTGIPMVVGGLHQDEQRYDWQVGERRNDMQNFFTTDNISRTLLILNKYDIEYVYVGQIERLAYKNSPTGLTKFQDMQGKYLDVAFSNDLVTIYHVNDAQRRQVQQDLGTAPGTLAIEPTPRPRPTEPALGDDPALRSLQAAVKAAPNNLDAHRALADYYHNHGAIQSAITEFVEVVRLAPADVAAHHQLGDLYMENGEPDKALAVWEDATKSAGEADKAAAFNKVGIAYRDRHRYEDAINAFKSTVAANPRFVEAWFQMGGVYLTLQDVDHAKEAFRNCISNADATESGQHWKQEAQTQLDKLK